MAGTQVTITKCRVSFVNVWTPKSYNGGPEKYSVTLLIPKADKASYDRIQKAIASAKDAFKQKNGKALPTACKTTLYDGNGTRPSGEEFGPECKDHWVITVSSNNKPMLVYPDKTQITEGNVIYSGCHCRAIINFYGYDNAGNKGITAGLNGLMFLEDGEPLGGARVTESDWDVDDEELF